ncbi:MAG: LysE family transporter [Candidatus Magasanikbacteria bacterium]|jgi:threonine/homoserine/homoserine lactone efflux protein
MKVFSQILEVFVLGLIGGAVPGPMLTAVFTEVLNGGFKKSFKVIFRALSAEVIVAIAILLVVFSLQIPQLYFYILSLAGAIFLIWLASNIWKINKVGEDRGEIFSFYRIFILTILSGAFWIFWLTVCVPRAFALKEQIVGGQFLFLLAFELGWIVMTGFLAYVFSKFRPLLLKKNLVSTIFKVFALLLVFFALKSIWMSVVYLITN